MLACAVQSTVKKEDSEARKKRKKKNTMGGVKQQAKQISMKDRRQLFLVYVPVVK